jgi:hypothetical protein
MEVSTKNLTSPNCNAFKKRQKYREWMDLPKMWRNIYFLCKSVKTYIPHFREVKLWNFDPRDVHGRVRRKRRDPFRGVSGAASGAERA